MTNGRKPDEYTDQQRLGSKSLAVLKAFKESAIPLTYTEVGGKVGLGKSGVAYHINILKSLTLIENKPYSPRSTK